MARRRSASVTEGARQQITRRAVAAARRLKNYGIYVPPGARPQPIPRDGIVVMPARGEILYRLLAGEEARQRDFLSGRDKGRTFPDLPFVINCGLSMYEHPDQALLQATRYPISVAAMTLERDLGLTLAKTYGVGHYTVWGDPEVLLEQAEPLGYLEG